jgi:hypothetical protein
MKLLVALIAATVASVSEVKSNRIEYLQQSSVDRYRDAADSVHVKIVL